MYKIKKVPEFFKEWMEYTNVSFPDLEKTINSTKPYVKSIYGLTQSVIDIKCIKCNQIRTKTKNNIETQIKKELFKTFFENKEFSIWEFEDKTNFFELQFMVKIGPEKKRGLYHYDSLVFPYTATAINKGRWNMTEYQKELNDIFEEYDINPFDRGIW